MWPLVVVLPMFWNGQRIPSYLATIMEVIICDYEISDGEACSFLVFYVFSTFLLVNRF